MAVVILRTVHQRISLLRGIKQLLLALLFLHMHVSNTAQANLIITQSNVNPFEQFLYSYKHNKYKKRQ